VKLPYLKKNSINLSDTMKENEQACSYGLTMDRPWSAMFGSSFILSSFHGHSDLGVSVGSQATLIYGQIWDRMAQKPIEHSKEPYPRVKPRKEFNM